MSSDVRSPLPVPPFILDPFFRFHSSTVTITRKALKPFTFSNGISVPEGTFISAPSTAIHYDPANYVNPHEFDGFRFTQKEDCAPGIEARNKMVASQPEYIPFGLGKHAWWAL